MAASPAMNSNMGLVAADDHLEGAVPLRPEAMHIFLTAQEVIARYGWGRTKGYRMLRSEGFPAAIGRDRYRLDALIAWENAQLHAPSCAVDTPRLPRRKRAS